MSSDYNSTRRQRKVADDPHSLLTRSFGALLEPEEIDVLPPPLGEYAPAEPMPATQASEPAEPVPVEEEEAAPDPPLCDECLDCASQSGAPFVTEEAA